MEQLLANLQSENLNRDVKPDILQVFGDMAQGLGPAFDPYMQPVVETLQAAMNIAYTNQVAYHKTDDPDESIIDYNNELRGAIVAAAEGTLSLPTCSCALDFLLFSDCNHKRCCRGVCGAATLPF
jgi:importin subunit beta-1